MRSIVKWSVILSWVCPAVVAIMTDTPKVCFVWVVPVILTVAAFGWWTKKKDN